MEFATGVEIPEGIKELATKEVKHNLVVSVDEIDDAVLKIMREKC